MQRARGCCHWTKVVRSPMIVHEAAKIVRGALVSPKDSTDFGDADAPESERSPRRLGD